MKVKVLSILLFALFAVPCVLSAGEKDEQSSSNILWSDNCHQANHSQWVIINGTASGDDQFVVSPDENKNPRIIQRLPWNKDYPYLQIKVADIVNMSKKYRGLVIAINNKKRILNLGGRELPGIFTFDLSKYYSLPDKTKTNGFSLQLSQHSGSYHYEYFRIMSLPENALTVKHIPGANSNNKQKVMKGDTLEFQVLLTAPAADVTVTVFNSYCLGKIVLSENNPYIQLKKEKGNGLIWKGKIEIGDKATPVSRFFGGILFKATVLGGEVNDLYTVNSLPFQIEK